MVRVKIRELVWNDHNREHIKKHNISIEEVENAIQNLIVHKKGKKGKYIAIGRTGKRILSVVIGREKTGVYYVVTARDSDKRERKIVYEKEKKHNSRV